MSHPDGPDHGTLRKNLDQSFRPMDRFLNRELSWLDFNNRVLEEAKDPDVPILERLKFLAIFSSNLDEFFMVRVAITRRQIEAGMTKKGIDGLRPAEVIERITARVHEAHENIGQCYRNQLLPALSAQGVTIITDLTASEEQREFAVRHYKTNLHPLVTPLAVDPHHPFRNMETGALYFCVELQSPSRKGTRIALLRLPTNAVGRFVRVPPGETREAVIMIDDIIRLGLGGSFPREVILGCYEIKIVRDSELDLDEIGSTDLMKAIKEGLERRKKGAATRFLHDPATPQHILDKFVRKLGLSRVQMFPGARYHSFSDMMQLPSVLKRPDLMYPPIAPCTVRDLDEAGTIVSIIQKKDILLHHPYQSFSYVNRFFEEAAVDPSVVSIMATLYRVSGDSRIAMALASAAKNGKQVTVVVELKARFDEERNIGWGRMLEDAGARVIYGVKKLKVHCKLAMVVRKEGKALRKYCHLSTGNYNDRTARLYVDLGLLTAHPEIGQDIATTFALITGDGPQEEFMHFFVAPEFLHKRFVKRIRREAARAREGKRAGIIAKMNSLVDPEIIDELYLANQAGVPIRLIVRGICCLRPGIAGLSDRIEVTSIVDRYLEHARIYRFENNGNPEIFLSSADWMPRNLHRRIEVAFPLLDPAIKEQVEEILRLQLLDTVKGRRLNADGTHVRQGGGVRSQMQMYELAGRYSG